MLRIFKVLRKFRDDESGATAIEYGLIAALISIGGIAAMTAIGDSMAAIFTSVSTVVDVGADRAGAVASKYRDGGAGDAGGNQPAG